MSFEKRFKAAIFDMDGTMTDTMYVWESLSNRYLVKHGITPPPDLNEKLGILGVHKAAEFLRSEFSLPKTPEQIFAELVEVLNDYYQLPHPLRPGTVFLLSELKKRQVTTAVLSATVLRPVKTSLKTAGIDGFFDYVFSTEDMPYSKVKPQAFIDTAARIGAAPEETIVFEDALYAIESAKSAGFTVCAVPDHTAKFPETIRQLADIYLADFSEFPLHWFADGSCR